MPQSVTPVPASGFDSSCDQPLRTTTRNLPSPVPAVIYPVPPLRIQLPHFRKTLDDMDATSSALCDQKVKAFLLEYRKTEVQDAFRELADATRRKVEDILKGLNPPVTAVVQSRPKAYASLETKLNDMATNRGFRD